MQMVWKEGGRGPPQGWEPQVFEESDDDDVAMVICPQGRPAGVRARRCRAGPGGCGGAVRALSGAPVRPLSLLTRRIWVRCRSSSGRLG